MILPSGTSTLDRILDGGLSTGKFTHIFGEAGTGKTTVALQFVNTACRLGVRAVFINSESTSPIERLEQITRKCFDEIEDKVRVIAPKSFSEQAGVIDDLELYALEDTKLIVIDTLTRLYRLILENRKATYAAHRELNRQAGILKGLAVHHNMAILVLNQVRGKLDSPGESEPVASNILDFWADYAVRLLIGRQTGQRILRRISPKGGTSTGTFYLTDKGLDVSSRSTRKSEMSL